MKKLTPDQRYYRKKKKEAERNFRRMKDRDGKLSIKVTRKVLNVSIKQEAFIILEDLAKRAKLSKWEMLSRILLYQIPQYQSLNSSEINRYDWPTIKPAKTKHYKGSTGNKQITYRINSTAWKKLDCHSKAVGKSKARLVQELIMDHKQIPDKTINQKKEKVKNHKEKHENYHSKNLTKKLFINSDNVIVHKKGIPMDKWDDDEYRQLENLQKIQIKMFKDMQRKQAEENLLLGTATDDETAKYSDWLSDDPQDISEPPDWI